VSRSILAVDDSPSMRRLVVHVLTSGGYTVFEAADGVKALDLARTHRIDAILTDQNMPDMDGITLVRRLRTLEGYADTPIMLLTLECSADLKQRGREAGATGWMVKPFDPERLLEAVARVLP
jgi:two-component system, chemotaxis family, chemotaxis protein CheY